MSRPLRILYPHACYHVMNRGAGRKKIYENNLHRQLFLELLDECQQMFNLQIHAYCLMDNHYHLLISTPDANLSRAMRHINGVYTQRYNRVAETDGPLFRGRYTARLIEDDCYQLAVSRYIHLNPVEANIVAAPSDYKWSSYKAYVGLVEKPRWLTTLLHGNNYQDYVENKPAEELDSAPIIGSAKFKDGILRTVDLSLVEACAPDIKRAMPKPTIDNLIDSVCGFYNISRKTLLSSRRGHVNWPRMVCIYLCRKYFGYTLRAIAEAFRANNYASISSTVCKCEVRIKMFKLGREINHVNRSIMEQILQADT